MILNTIFLLAIFAATEYWELWRVRTVSPLIRHLVEICYTCSAAKILVIGNY